MSELASLDLVDIVQTRSEAQGLSKPPLMILESLEEELDRRGLGHGQLAARRIGDGHSNATFALWREDWEGILRRPPRPPYQPKAHDMMREVAFQEALAGHVPVPVIQFAVEQDPDLQVPYYVMDWVHGDVITDDLPAQIDTPQARRSMVFSLVDTLANLHSVDPNVLDGRFRRDGSFADRQLATFGALWDSHRTRDLKDVEIAGTWLAQNKPPETVSIVHGDYRLGNVMFGTELPPTVTAVLDWEVATVGDPLSDLGYLLSTYPENPDERGPLLDLAGAIAKSDMPSRAELRDRYAEVTGRDLSGLRWWTVLAFWRTAVGLESFYRRGVAGTTDDPFIHDLEHGVPLLASDAVRAIEEW